MAGWWRRAKRDGSLSLNQGGWDPMDGGVNQVDSRKETARKQR